MVFEPKEVNGSEKVDHHSGGDPDAGSRGAGPRGERRNLFGIVDERPNSGGPTNSLAFDDPNGIITYRNLKPQL